MILWFSQQCILDISSLSLGSDKLHEAAHVEFAPRKSQGVEYAVVDIFHLGHPLILN